MAFSQLTPHVEPGQKPVLFKIIVSQRHWQRFDTFQTRFRQAAMELASETKDPEFSMADVSRRQFDRWLSGEIRTLPRPIQCMILERLLETPARALFSVPAPEAESAIEHGAIPKVRPNAGSDAMGQLDAASDFASSFLLDQDTMVGAAARDALFDDVQELCRLYPSAPAQSVLERLLDTQRRALEACKREQRGVLSADLYFLGGISSALVAKASQELGRRDAARKQLRLASYCSEVAGHTDLQAWVRGVASLISYWFDDFESAAVNAAAGRSMLRSPAGSLQSWLPALEARAHAMRGDAVAAKESIKASDDAMQRIVPSELDRFGGLLTFAPTKQQYYTSEALVLLNEPASEAKEYAENAVAGLDRDPDAAYGDEAGARANLSLARAHEGDLEGSFEALGPVLSLSPISRTDGIVRSVDRVRTALSVGQYIGNAVAAETCDKIARFAMRDSRSGAERNEQ